MTKDYNKSLNLPLTDFPMRGSLHTRDQQLFDDINKNKIYDKIIEKNKDKPLFLLHDGPPYANGDIHLGTALNKILKDIIIKNKNMSGFRAPFIPGWDTHGLPIELKAFKSSSKAKNLTEIEIREKCKEFALSCVKSQGDQFKSLGVIGEFDKPYLTLNKEFEAKQIEVFGKMSEKDLIYKGLKPVYWCIDCNTALAEAEIEYDNNNCDSIYVKFELIDNSLFSDKIDKNKKIYFVIWTTTTWTLPANVAICLGENFEYAVVKYSDEYLIIAKELVSTVMEISKIEEYSIIEILTGKKLEFLQTKHPFLNRKSLIILGDHVTLESGTGCVHTAPGHGMDDFLVCSNYDNLEVIVPVNERGVYNSHAGLFEGMHISKVGNDIIDQLKLTNNLLAINKISHQYPHCWRCKKAVIFRATEQWFYSIEKIKEVAISEIDKVVWNPSWGKDRMINMIKDRSDWCISRQRLWGVPIPIIYCSDCGDIIISPETIEIISEIFKKEGSDSWYKRDASDFLPKNYSCKCGSENFRKEKDIMDVWFDSGVSNISVLETREGLDVPADLYFEGNDQYRGWFQSSILTSISYRNSAPYKNILSHGWVVDGDGKKMSKSIGNGINPDSIIKEYGADILRLWAASSDYHSDIRISKDILKNITEGYRKIRNTFRFLLGNLSDFNPDIDIVDTNSISDIDKWTLFNFNNLLEKVELAYKNFEFHQVYQMIRNFCVVDLSNYYLDIVKDRLYCERKNSKKRRDAQTTMYIILENMAKILAPILAFTSEEVWKYMPHKNLDNIESILLNDFKNYLNLNLNNDFIEKWDKMYKIKDQVLRAMEIKREEKIIGSSLEANVVIHSIDKNLIKFIRSNLEDLKTIFISSSINILEDDNGEYNTDISGLSISISKALGEKCARCWMFSYSVGLDTENLTICSRCCLALD